MKNLPKYALLLFILTTISMIYRLSPLKSFEIQLNIGTMVLGLILALIYPGIFFKRKNVRIFKVIYGMFFINLFYQFTFGWLNFRLDDIFYLSAKISLTIIIVVSIVLNPSFYFKDILKWLGLFLALLFIVGFLKGQTDNLTGRYHFGFTNPNEAGATAAIGFGIFLIKDDTKKLLRIGLMVLFAFAVVMTGSRSAIILLLLALVFKYKLNFRLVVGFSLFAILIFSIMPYLNLSMSGVERLMGTVGIGNKTVLFDRESEFEAGLLMFYNKFWTGYGLSAYRIVDYSIMPSRIGLDTLGTHNGYICAAKMYGILFLIPFLYVVLVNYFKLLRKYFNSKNHDITLHLFIISVGIIGALAEDYLIGVNSLVTFLCFASFSILEYCSSNENNNLLINENSSLS